MNWNDQNPVVLGIDPGLDGGLAWILPDRVEARVTPTLAGGKGGGKRAFDVSAMLAMLELHRPELVVLEAVSAAPVAGRVQGTKSMFGFGRGFGIWEGIIAALRLPHLLVAPQSWKKVVLEGTAKDKLAAITFAQRRFPGVSLLATPRSRVPHDGMADALCLADYGRRQLVGQTVKARGNGVA